MQFPLRRSPCSGQTEQAGRGEPLEISTHAPTSAATVAANIFFSVVKSYCASESVLTVALMQDLDMQEIAAGESQQAPNSKTVSKTS